MPIGKDNFRHI